MPQFFTQPKNIKENLIFLSREESHHLHTVLRKNKGDVVLIADGQGTQYNCEILDAGKLLILSRQKSETQKPKLHLACSLLKNVRMDWLIEKAVEIGCDCITPLLSEHAVVDLKTEKDKQKKLDRLSALAQAALKQSQNTLLPTLLPIQTLDSFLQSVQNSKVLKVMFHPYHSKPIQELEPIFSQAEECLFLLGPEGGFSEHEVKKAQAIGFDNYHLGSNILRGETAALYVLSLFNYWRGK